MNLNNNHVYNFAVYRKLPNDNFILVKESETAKDVQEVFNTLSAPYVTITDLTDDNVWIYKRDDLSHA